MEIETSLVIWLQLNPNICLLREYVPLLDFNVEDFKKVRDVSVKIIFRTRGQGHNFLFWSRFHVYLCIVLRGFLL
jgi:hypothetical protein